MLGYKLHQDCQSSLCSLFKYHSLCPLVTLNSTLSLSWLRDCSLLTATCYWVSPRARPEPRRALTRVIRAPGARHNLLQNTKHLSPNFCAPSYKEKKKPGRIDIDMDLWLLFFGLLHVLAAIHVPAPFSPDNLVSYFYVINKTNLQWSPEARSCLCTLLRCSSTLMKSLWCLLQKL